MGKTSTFEIPEEIGATMTINIKYTAQLKKAAGTSEEKIDIAAADNLEQLLHILARRHDQDFSRMLFDEQGQFSNTTVLVLNDRQVRLEDNIALKENDQFLLLSPIAGG